MFDRLTSGFSTALKALTGRGRLTDDNIADTVRQVRLALLEADVALPVVKTFTDAVKARAVGVEVAEEPDSGPGVHQGGARGIGSAHGRVEYWLEFAGSTARWWSCWRVCRVRARRRVRGSLRAG